MSWWAWAIRQDVQCQRPEAGVSQRLRHAFEVQPVTKGRIGVMDLEGVDRGSPGLEQVLVGGSRVNPVQAPASQVFWDVTPGFELVAGPAQAPEV